MERNIVEVLLTPKVPKVIDNQQLMVYIPFASSKTPGVVMPNDKDFVVGSDGALYLKVSFDAGGKSLAELLAEINAALTSLSNNKQNKTDNNLQTVSKQVVGAINENASNINAEESAREAVDNNLQAQITAADGEIADLSKQVYGVGVQDTLAYKVATIAANYITRLVNNLEYYYDKNTVDTKISQVSRAMFLKVSELPETGETNYIYLVPKSNDPDSTDNDNYDEWIWTLQEKAQPTDPDVYDWEHLGSTDIDLSNYPTIEQMNQAIAQAIAAIQVSTDGLTVRENTTGKLEVIGVTNGTDVLSYNDLLLALTVERL